MWWSWHARFEDGWVLCLHLFIRKHIGRPWNNISRQSRSFLWPAVLCKSSVAWKDEGKLRWEEGWGLNAKLVISCDTEQTDVWRCELKWRGAAVRIVGCEVFIWLVNCYLATQSFDCSSYNCNDLKHWHRQPLNVTFPKSRFTTSVSLQHWLSQTLNTWSSILDWTLRTHSKVVVWNTQLGFNGKRWCASPEVSKGTPRI